MARRSAVVVGASLVLVSAGGCLSLPSFEPTPLSETLRAQGVTGQVLSTEGGELHLVSTPRRGGTAVVFVHGSPGTWEAFRDYLEHPELARQAQLIAVDRPGFGLSSRGRAEPSLEVQAARIEAAVAQIHNGPFVLVGHSLGGPVAARFAADFPSQTAGLVLVAPSLDPALERRRWFNVAASLRPVQWFLSVDWITSNREIWPHREELELLAPRLAAIEQPVIVIQGMKDNLVPAANADFAERAFKRAQLEVRRYPNDGHFVLWQKPELVRGAVLEVLQSSDASRRIPTIRSSDK